MRSPLMNCTILIPSTGMKSKNHIYGAGLGLGNVSLKEIEKEIETYCTQVFRPRGSSQMGELLEKIKVNEQEILLIQKKSAPV